MAELSDRQRFILSLVVRDFVETAVPVGSEAVGQRYRLALSSATIRKEMAALEEMGLLTHPYTSAGRVPTIDGYRYFVEQLMQEMELPVADQRMIQHQFHQAGVDLEAWMHLAAAVVARSAHAAGLVTAPHSFECRLKHLELIAINDPLVLVVAVLQDGTVLQHMLTTGEPATQEDLSRMSHQISDRLRDKSRHEIEASTGQFSGFVAQVVAQLLDMMGQIDHQGRIAIYREGLANVLSAPEFAQADRARDVIRMLEEGALLEAVLAEVGMGQRGVQVIVGGGERWSEFGDYGLVLARYGVPDEAAGVLGVFGPVRLPYERAVSTVRFVAGLMSHLISELYGY